jgi:8-oxo-dGTP diphosphatase
VSVDGLWFLAENAGRRAARARHELVERHDGYVERTHRTRVSRARFRTLADRIERTGGPYGAHTIVHRDGELVLCRHEGVGRWVLPGGEVDPGESFRAAAERELAEEAGMTAEYDGLAVLTRIDVSSREHDTWGVMPVFAARPTAGPPTAADPDGEIREARWFGFDALPADTRDRADLLAWYDRFGRG